MRHPQSYLIAKQSEPGLYKTESNFTLLHRIIPHIIIFCPKFSRTWAKMLPSPPLSPSISPVTETESQDVSHTLLPSSSEEEFHNGIGTEEFTIQSQSCVNPLSTDSFVPPDSPELLTLHELFAPFTNWKHMLNK
ncbi:hypothetical protein Clacol_008590 [Clathrus columnatus]|uniref:Uncharacterized protein n=1 Tax=Clathrus columnatus TaxID=1419009 RepID=A0AAV5AI58_9AGAM|nr:hypothetical protein Clacol_008590 [Clathrus columnatus]